MHNSSESDPLKGSSTYTAYMNAVGAMLICVFIAGIILAYKLLLKWRDEELEAAGLPTQSRRSRYR